MDPLYRFPFLNDIGCEIYEMSDNTPANWRIFRSLTNPTARYINTGNEWLRFESETAMDDYLDSLDALESEDYQ